MRNAFAYSRDREKELAQHLTKRMRGACLSVMRYMVINAYHSEGIYFGEKIQRGEIPASIQGIMNNTGLSQKTVRNTLKQLEKLKETGKQRAIQGANRTTLYRIVNYELWDSLSEKGQTNGTERGNQGANPYNKDSKEVKEVPPSPPPRVRDLKSQRKIPKGSSVEQEVITLAGTLLKEFNDTFPDSGSGVVAEDQAALIRLLVPKSGSTDNPTGFGKTATQIREYFKFLKSSASIDHWPRPVYLTTRVKNGIGNFVFEEIERKTKAAQQSVDPGSGTGGQRIPTAEEVRIEGNKARIREREKREKDERK